MLGLAADMVGGGQVGQDSTEDMIKARDDKRESLIHLEDQRAQIHEDYTLECIRVVSRYAEGGEEPVLQRLDTEIVIQDLAAGNGDCGDSPADVRIAVEEIRRLRGNEADEEYLINGVNQLEQQILDERASDARDNAADFWADGAIIGGGFGLSSGMILELIRRRKNKR